MQPKIRDLIRSLERAGFKKLGGKGSHRNYKHPNVEKPLTLSGKPSADAKPYQVKLVKHCIEDSTK